MVFFKCRKIKSSPCSLTDWCRLNPVPSCSTPLGNRSAAPVTAHRKHPHLGPYGSTKVCCSLRLEGQGLISATQHRRREPALTSQARLSLIFQALLYSHPAHSAVPEGRVDSGVREHIQTTAFPQLLKFLNIHSDAQKSQQFPGRNKCIMPGL